MEKCINDKGIIYHSASAANLYMYCKFCYSISIFVVYVPSYMWMYLSTQHRKFILGDTRVYHINSPKKTKVTMKSQHLFATKQNK